MPATCSSSNSSQKSGHTLQEVEKALALSEEGQGSAGQGSAGQGSAGQGSSGAQGQGTVESDGATGMDFTE